MSGQAPGVVICAVEGEPEHALAIVQATLAQLAQQGGLAEAGGGADQDQADVAGWIDALQQVVSG
ncbi:hypothetical protein D3C77_372830 [compost metagenome]